MRFIYITSYFICFIISNNAFSQYVLIETIKKYVNETSNDENGSVLICKNDINFDGYNDLGLSLTETWGNAGGEWIFFLGNKNNMYTYYDRIELMYDDVCIIQNINNEKKIMKFYLRTNCCSGSIITLKIEKTCFKLDKIYSIGNPKTTDSDSLSVAVDKILSKGKKLESKKIKINYLKKLTDKELQKL